MQGLFKYLLFIAIVLGFSTQSNAQCKEFAKKVAKTDLTPYIHDGIFNATTLAEGESAELFKTFYSGQQYRLSVSGDNSLAKVEFEVLDGERNVLFNNKTKNFAKYWDFKLESSQQLIISIQVPEGTSEILASGCVAVLVGFKNTDEPSKFE